MRYSRPEAALPPCNPPNRRCDYEAQAKRLSGTKNAPNAASPTGDLIWRNFVVNSLAAISESGRRHLPPNTADDYPKARRIERPTKLPAAIA